MTVSGKTICEITFASTSAQTWTVPDGVTKIDMVLVGGGGAGGDGADYTGTSDGGGGGGAGGQVVAQAVTVTPAGSVTITAGAGGVGQLSNGNGNNGSSTQVTIGANVMTAIGGNGGLSGKNTSANGGNLGNITNGGATSMFWYFYSPRSAASAQSSMRNGGGGAGAQTGGDGLQSNWTDKNNPVLGHGGDGSPGKVPTVGLFNGTTTAYGGGGGGGAAETGGPGGVARAGGGAGGLGGESDVSQFGQTGGNVESPTAGGNGADGTGGGGGGGGAHMLLAAVGGNGGNGTVIFRFSVPTAPAFTAVAPPGGVKGTAYAGYTFTASGEPAATFAVTSGTLPTGLSLDSSTGVLSGTPTASGDFTFTVTASNGISPDAVSDPITVTIGEAPVFTASTPPLTATNGAAYAGYTFAASGPPAPTYTVDSGTLPTGMSLDATTGVLSGTPTTAGDFTFTVTAANGISPDATTASITITVTRAAASGSGGGSGGGGSSPTPAPTPTPTPTPSATAAPALEPTLPGSNPNIPTGGVPLGGSVFLVNGEPVPVTVKPDAPSTANATGLDIQGPGFTMRLVGQTANNRPLGLTPDGALILEQDRTAFTEGTGFKPNSEVQLYVFSEPRFLGTVNTDANGSFRGSVPLPVDIPAGRHTLQSNGFAPDGAVRSLSLGVQVQDLTKPTARPTLRTTKATVYFDAYSATLDASGRKALKSLAAGRAKSTTRIVSVGYVQPNDTTANDKSLSTQRAKAVAKYLKSIGVRGVVVTRGDGVADQTGAAGRKAVVTLTYRK